MSETTITETEVSIPCSPLQFKPVPGETLDSFEGFMCYFNLGHNRTLKDVAKKLDLNLSTVKEWSAKHHWVDRILEYETHLFNARINSEATAARESALAQGEREALRRQKNAKLSNFLTQLAEKLLEHHLLHNLDNTKLADILKIFALGAKIGGLGADDAPLDPSEQEKSNLIAVLEETFRRIKLPGASALIEQLTEGAKASTPAPQT